MPVALIQQALKKKNGAARVLDLVQEPSWATWWETEWSSGWRWAFTRRWVSASTVRVRSFGATGHQMTCVELSLIWTHICGLLRSQEDTRTGGMRRWTQKIKRKLNESGRRAFPPFHVAAVSSGWQFCVFGFPFSSSSSSASPLPSSSSASSLILLSRYFEWSRVQRMSFCKCLTHWALKHGPSGCFVCALLF